MNIKIETIINNKLRDVKLNFAAGTYKFYQSHCSHFLKWCFDNGYQNIIEFTDDALVDYISEMKKTASNTTINKRIGMLKRVFSFNNINFDFLYNLKKLKETKKTFNILETKELKKIIDHVMALNTKEKLMYKALILLLIDTGARINEVINIKISNIKIEANEILLTTTKTNEDRVVFFLDDTKDIIQSIIDLKNDSKFLLYNVIKKRQIKYDDVRYFMRYLKETLNIDKLHAHMFRHTFATIFVEKDADLVSVMQVLGHKNIETTERYLHLSKKHVKKTYQTKFNR